MAVSKWLAQIGGPGSAARWAAKAYRKLRVGHPDWAKVRDIDIFRLIVASRYAVLPHPKAQAFLEGWLSNENQGLERVVVGILIAEHGWNAFDFPQMFRDVVHEELVKSGLPESVLRGGNLHAALKTVASTITILLAIGDEHLTRFFSDSVRSISTATVHVISPVTVHDADLWASASEQRWDLAILQINNIRYSSYADSRDSWQEDSVKFVRKMAEHFAKPIICSYPSASWLTAEYPRQLLEAGARGLIQIPCTADVIRQTVKQCLSFQNPSGGN